MLGVVVEPLVSNQTSLKGNLRLFQGQIFSLFRFLWKISSKTDHPCAWSHAFQDITHPQRPRRDSGLPRRVRPGSRPRALRRAGHTRAEPLAEKRVGGPWPLQGCFCRASHSVTPTPPARPKEKRQAAHALQAEPGSPASTPCGTHHDSGRRSSYSALKLPPMQGDPQSDLRAT